VPIDPSWTPHAVAVLERAFEHHGGVTAWYERQLIRLFPDKLSGFVPWQKGMRKTFPLPRAIEVAPHERKTTFVYPDDEHVGVFHDGMVKIMVRESGRVLESSINHRQLMLGPPRARRFGSLDVLCFLGYALWHYHAMPFTLGAGRLLGMRSLDTRDARLDVLELELPRDVPTHCRRQSFYFDDQGQLVRHDYHAEVLGAWARAAHLWKRQTRVDGCPIALDRHVLFRLGSVAVPMTALRMTFSGAEVERDSSELP
jgi:hypothetical protein